MRNLAVVAMAALVTGCTVSANDHAVFDAGQLAEAVRTVERERLIKIGLACLDRFQDTWNTRDTRQFVKAFNFPHVRPSPTDFGVRWTPEDYVAASKDSYNVALSQGWHRSQWDRREVLHVSPDKMHFAGQYVRLREDGSRIRTGRMTYIVTRQGERWAIQSRFSTQQAPEGSKREGEDLAKQAVEAYFEAFNSLDLERWADSMHYPQVRLSASGLGFWKTRQDFLDGPEMGRQRTHHQTRLDIVEPYQVGAKGVNVKVRYTRLNSEKEDLSTYDAIYLVTNRDGNWAVQARSTYAP